MYADVSFQVLLELQRQSAKKSEKKQPKEFVALNEKELTATETCQERLITSPILAIPYARGRYTLESGACNVQVESRLLQDQSDAI